MSLPSKLQKVAAPTRTYVGQTIQPNWSDHGQYRKSGYWWRIDGVWYHRTDMLPYKQTLKADIIIVKNEHSVFSYTKHRGHGDLRPLNEAELKEMAWIILSAEKA